MTSSIDEIMGVLTGLSRASSTRAIYPAEHPSVAEAVDSLLSALDRCLAKRDDEAVTFLIIDREVVVDDRPLRTKSMHLRPFIRIVDRLGIQRLTLARGVTAEECQSLLTALATATGVESTDHVVIGRVAIGEEGGGEDWGEFDVPGWDQELSETDIDRGSDAFLRMVDVEAGSVEELDRLVWRVMEGLAGSSRSLLLLAPIKGFDQHLFLHSVNVAMLTIAQARSLGIEGALLHEIGLSALLHDVGKLALPRKLWLDRGRLEGEEWERAKLHPELGAAMLCGAEGVPPLAVLVAYEHHLRWDGEPSYPRCRRTPTMASQLTAVADTWDTLVTGHDEFDPTIRRAALRVWRERSGTYLDPFLVGNFMLMMTAAGEGPG